jgi:hypothetical protein
LRPATGGKWHLKKWHLKVSTSCADIRSSLRQIVRQPRRHSRLASAASDEAHHVTAIKRTCQYLAHVTSRSDPSDGLSWRVEPRSFLWPSRSDLPVFPYRIHLDTATIARSIEHGTLCQRSCRPPRMIAPALGNRTVMPLHIGNLVRWIKSRVVQSCLSIGGRAGAQAIARRLLQVKSSPPATMTSTSPTEDTMPPSTRVVAKPSVGSAATIV